MNSKGRMERVFVDLESVYPTGDDQSGVEFCFEELRARHRGWLDKDWKSHRKTNIAGRNTESNETSEGTAAVLGKLQIHCDAQDSENAPPKTIPLNDSQEAGEAKATAAAKAAKKARKEERANRTRKIQVMEVRAETQTGISSNP
jgi:checkpoint serine/threonine-protein kinase